MPGRQGTTSCSWPALPRASSARPRGSPGWMRRSPSWWQRRRWRREANLPRAARRAAAGLSTPDLTAPGPALPLRAQLFGLRDTGDPRVRHTSRTRARRLAAAALQPVQPRRAGSAAGLRVTPMILANVIESAFGPLISFFQAILVAVHSVVGGSWGWSIIGLT